jgi:hypothetical protein
MRKLLMPAFLVGTVLATATSPAAAGMSNDEMIANAMSAAPAAVAKNATVATFDDKMQVVELKKGTNNFTCMPDDPTTPTNDPMCADENAMAWVHALLTKTPPPEGKIGFAYMLQGETAASNADPFAPPPADGKWSEAGPHVMILNAKAANAGYPKSGNTPDITQPFVMWQDTPYEHLMIPVN